MKTISTLLVSLLCIVQLTYSQNYSKQRLKENSKVFLPDGRLYVGEFTYELINGVFDSLSIKRNGIGITYKLHSNIIESKGNYLENVPNGYGTFFSDEGIIVFEGNITDGTPNGLGKKFNEFGRIYYEGDWVDGEMTGNGKLYGIETRALYYQGQFISGKFNGDGKLFYPNGTMRYEGDFKSDKFEGTGKEFDFDGSLKYEGEFKSGSYNGKGKIYEGGTLVYEGDFKNNIINGVGKSFYKSGEVKATGEYKNGKLNGFGKFYHWEGRLFYEGQFIENEFSGYGKYYGDNADKLEYEGEFVSNVFSGKGKYYKNGKLVYTGEFRNGNFYDPGNSVTSSQNSITQDKPTIFSQIFENLNESERKYLNQVFKMNSDPNNKIGTPCTKFSATCNWCGKTFLYNKVYQSRINIIQETQNPQTSKYGNAMMNLAFSLFGGSKLMGGETKNSAIAKWANDLKEDLQLIRSGSIYYCTGDAPKFCSEKCKREYSYR